jgi:hypothetical protein
MARIGVRAQSGTDVVAASGTTVVVTGTEIKVTPLGSKGTPLKVGFVYTGP